MDWLFEADRDAERRFPWISIPGVASNNQGVILEPSFTRASKSVVRAGDSQSLVRGLNLHLAHLFPK